MSTKTFYAWVLCGLIGLFTIGLLANQLLQRPIEGKRATLPTPSEVEESRRKVKQVPLEDALGVTEGELVEVGGVKRPKRDIDFENGNVDSSVAFPNPGRAPALAGDETPQVAAYFAELKSGKVTQDAKSSFFKPVKFKRDRYLNDPEGYLAEVRPGRTFQVANPGPDVTRIVAKSKLFNRILQGETTTLQVTAEPGMPVTFHTSGVGEFDNRLTTLTVKADENGVATANYLATSGTLGLMEITASSPVHSDYVSFMVKVGLPEIAMK